jgi:hypothetical protein
VVVLTTVLSAAALARDVGLEHSESAERFAEKTSEKNSASRQLHLYGEPQSHRQSL